MTKRQVKKIMNEIEVLAVKYSNAKHHKKKSTHTIIFNGLESAWRRLYDIYEVL